MRNVNWYLRGWEYQEINGKKELVYVGDYYTYRLSASGLLRMKAGTVFLYIFSAAAFAAAVMRNGSGMQNFYSGLPAMLAQIPMIYELIGSARFLFVRKYMTYRDYRGASCTIRWSSWCAGILLLISAAGHAVYMALNGRTGTETASCILILASGLLTAGIAVLHTVVKIDMPPKKLVPENAWRRHRSE